MRKIIIAGSRKFSDKLYLKSSLKSIIRDEKEEIEIVSGGAKGTDSLAKIVAEELGLGFKEFLAEWDNLEDNPKLIKSRDDGSLYNALAGYNRNLKMADYGDELLAFWDHKSSGTKDMIEQMRIRSKVVNIFYFN